ncbi:cuticle protein 10.9-like [Ixodes scapularis]|uniref:cuticle protein 10.9-like n=1 Tax=Ixodes scapularis TaxID=6945 RepID=UPI001A9E7834|nr:cuticle protein 10.9-like [Ixodes scapularis]
MKLIKNTYSQEMLEDMQKRLFEQVAFLVGCLCVAAAQRGFEENYGPPIPYAFNYLSQLQDGSHSHEQSGDGSGRVQGKYTLTDADGRSRTVTYYADASGFHAEVITNELGTESKNPADVVIRSSAPTGPEAAIANEPNRFRG